MPVEGRGLAKARPIATGRLLTLRLFSTLLSGQDFGAQEALLSLGCDQFF